MELFIALAASVVFVVILLNHINKELNYKFDKKSWIVFIILCLSLFNVGAQFYESVISPRNQLDVYRGKTSLRITKLIVDGKVVKLDSTVIYK